MIKTWLGLTAHALLFSTFSCKYMDGHKANPIREVSVINTFGSAKITFKVARQSDFSYIMASYPINKEKIRQVRSDLKGTLTVDGFSSSAEYTVILQAVGREGNISDPVKVKVHPLMPYHQSVCSALRLRPAYGGISVSGENKANSLLSLHLLSYNDTLERYVEKDVSILAIGKLDLYYGNMGRQTQRIAVYISDKFGNASDTVYKVMKPLREDKLDNTRFYNYPLQNDGRIGFDWYFRYLFDGNLGEPGWHTESMHMGGLMMGTVGLGTPSMISRLVLYNRLPGIYQDQNPKKFTVWASTKKEPKDFRDWPISTTPEGTVLGDWINLGNFVLPMPQSGLPPTQANNDDRAAGAGGFSFKLKTELNGARYMRFQCTQTWGGLDYVNANEITLFGRGTN
ncbi:DUF5000 domain-containing lipoprotein [Pedobacter psychrodurus]|nr:DUF5000 domain-containing lipoprotein [Pedobacter psychrodurus]